MSGGRPISLRLRVTVAAIVLGIVLSALFAGVTVYVSEKYEDVLVGELLQGQAQDYSLRLALDPAATLPQSHRLSGYLRRRDGSGVIPAELAPLGPGFYDDAHLPDGIHAGVYDIAQGRLYFAIDLSDIEATEQLLAVTVIAIFLIGTGFAAWLGWFLAGASLTPLRRFAAAVEALPVTPQRTALAEGTGRDELGRLASAIDAYQARLADADLQERRFFADASHELRTPLAVVRGVTEVILDDPGAEPVLRNRLGRLDRGVSELGMLLDVLLGLARRRELIMETVDARRMVDDSLDALSAIAGREHLLVDNRLAGDWCAPRREVELLLQGVLRRLLAPDAAGQLQVSCEARQLRLRFTPRHSEPSAVSADAERSDTGMALTLVDRLAQWIGWQNERMPSTGGAREVRLTMPAGTNAVL
jgi:signal transduction histidine kinase